MKKATILVLLTVLSLSCGKMGKNNKILGEWVCTSWKAENNANDKCNNNVYFYFAESKYYYSQIGSMADSGKYKIVDGNLYLSPKGKMQFAVRITELDETTMELLMNRAGLEERLRLKKIQ